MDPLFLSETSSLFHLYYLLFHTIVFWKPLLYVPMGKAPFRKSKDWFWGKQWKQKKDEYTEVGVNTRRFQDKDLGFAAQRLVVE